jgi:benzoyl-CoA reductase/2-hydroxyglutaryl-CoA dehydratase subunit BcrC/BadD/HgdB
MKAISQLIETFKPDVVIDFILHACHGYNVESYRVAQHVAENHSIAFMKVETDYSDADAGQLKLGSRHFLKHCKGGRCQLWQVGSDFSGA